MKKKLWHIFSRIIECHNLRRQFFRVHKVFWQKLRSFESKSSGPRRLLKTQFFEKKAMFPVRKKLWPPFSQKIECDKPQITGCKDTQGFFTITVIVIRTILQDPGGCWKHNFLKKKAIFPVKKRFWPIFSHFIENNRVQEIIIEDPQGFFDDYFAIDKVFSLGPKRSIARNFSKSSCSHGDKTFWLTFHRIINCDKAPSL